MSALLTELLAWVAARPRTYEETMDVWRSSCPRHPVWEDATTDRLIEVLPATNGTGAIVSLTPVGRETLAAATNGKHRAS